MDKGNFSVVGAIALNSALGDNPKFSHQLIDRFGSMEELFSFGRSGKQDLFGPYSRFSSAFLEQSLEEAEKQYETLRRRDSVCQHFRHKYKHDYHL